MKFILHVLTRDSKVPWLVHFDDGTEFNGKRVYVNVPSFTMCEGHTPCANWYIQGTYHSYYVDGDTVTIS